MRKKRVTFIIPPLVDHSWTFAFDDLYLGASYVAACLLQNNNIEVTAIDCATDCRSLGRLKKRLQRTNPDIIAMPAIYMSLINAYKIAKLAKELFPRITVVLGGIPASYAYERVMHECPHIDICVIGEGEITMQEVVASEQLENVKGIAFRSGKEIITTPPRELIRDLNQLPLPARHLFPLKKYKNYIFYSILKANSTQLETKRGCPYACEFCIQAPKEGKQYRLRDVDNVIDELQYIKATYPFIRRIMFVDNDFLAPYQHGRSIMEEIIRNNLEEQFQFMIATRVPNFLRPGDDLITLCSRAKVRLVYFGIESVNEKNIKRLKKMKESYDLRALFKKMRAQDVHSVGSYIFGFENETKEDMLKTIEASFYDTPSIIKYNILTPYPGTELYKRYEKEGRLNPSVPLWQYDHTHKVFHHPVDMAKLFRWAYRKHELRWGYLKHCDTLMALGEIFLHHIREREVGGMLNKARRALQMIFKKDYFLR